MTQARRAKIALPALLLLVAVALLLGVILWKHRAPSAPELPPGHPVMGNAGANPIALLQTRAAEHPQDGEAWHALAAQYFDSARYEEAVKAYARSVQLLPNKAILWSALGEARVMASAHDPMPAEALSDFHRATAIDPKDPRARYFLAVARDLQGDHRGAIADWLALLADTPAGAAWQNDLVRTIQQVGKINAIDVDQRIAAVEKQQPAPVQPAMPTAKLPGPSASDIQAASGLSADQQMQMGAGMVEKLEQRLQADPRNPDGWVMLMRSRMTLGQRDLAAAALKRAIAANPEEADELRRQAAMLGIR